MAKILSSKRRLWLALGAVVGVALIAGAGFFFGYYRGHALPGVTVAGVSVSGLTPEQVQAQLTERAEGQVILLDVPGEDEQEVSLADVGARVDVEKTVQEVFQANGSPMAMIEGFFDDHEITPFVVVESERFSEFTDQLLPEDGHGPVDASVHFDADSSYFYTTESRPGELVDTAALEGDVVSAARSLEDARISVPTLASDPATQTEQAMAAAELANGFLDAQVSVTDSYYDTAIADRAQKAKWIKFKGEGDDYKPALKKKKATAWVDEFAEESSDAPTTGLRNVDENGEEVAVSLPAEDGYGADNVAKVVKAFGKALAAGEGVDTVFTYDVLPATWEDRPALPGTERLLYRPAEGEKWIDLDLTNASVTAYEGDQIVAGPSLMVPGDPLTPTVTGEYNVYLKYEIQDMRGENYDGSKYVTKDVPWVTYFYGGYGFHGAPWRSSFGWNGPGGSHGCINMEVADAKFIYDWADMGTKVISHD